MTDSQRLSLLLKCEKHLKLTTKGWKEEPVGEGSEWEAAMDALNRVQKDLTAKSKAAWENIGPITKPGASLLDYSLTHQTAGIKLFPAVDIAWGSGVSLYAPEECVIDTKDTSASPGEAIYLTLASGIRLWIGHLQTDHPIGKKFSKGALLGKTAYQPNKKAHGHIGVNAEKYLGKGRQLKYGRTGRGPDYTTGSPRIRTQLLALDL